MKQVLIFAFVALIALGCNDKSAGTADASTKDSAAMTVATEENIVYPYQLDQPYQDWRPGDKQHAVTAMSSLKAFENGDIAECVKGFGDSVELRFDGYRAKVSHDSLKTMFAESRAKLASLKIYMNDWESVVSKDGKKQYVTMWYKQIETDKKGKIDSLNVVDDAEISNGKIIVLDQKIQHFPAKKKM